MKIEIFKKHINSKNIYNPCDAFLKQAAKQTKIDKELLVPVGTLPIKGISFITNNCHRHHIFLQDLFPILREYGRGTLCIKCSPEMHQKLHEELAKSLSNTDFRSYEKLVKAECTEIKLHIAKIYTQRIAQLHANSISCFVSRFFNRLFRKHSK